MVSYRRSSEVPSVEDQRQINWEVSGWSGRPSCSQMFQEDVWIQFVSSGENKAALGGELLIQHHVSESAASNLKNLQKTKQKTKQIRQDR